MAMFGIMGMEWRSEAHPSGLVADVNEAAKEEQFPPCLLAAIAERESNCNPFAKSDDGGMGLCQVTSVPESYEGPWPPNEWDDAFTNAKFAAHYYLVPALLYWTRQGFDGMGLVKMIAAEYNEGRAEATKYHNFGDVDFGTTNDYAEGVLAIYLRFARESK